MRILIAVGLSLVCQIGGARAKDVALRYEASGAFAANGQARSVILFVGDGMGEAQRTAARWAAVGQDGFLAMDMMPIHGWSRTASADSLVTDSAAAATAIATGVKTGNGVIAQDSEGNPLATILEYARDQGMATGLVTTVQMTHATPAAFASHVPSRTMMLEIASQMLANEVDVLLGGGEDYFLPSDEMGCYSGMGKRGDGRDLIAEAAAKGYTYVCDPAQLTAVNPISTTRLLGLFAGEGMTRPYSPTLATMARMAIDILSRDPDGFFLMVEGGQIDWACHANDAANAISDTIGMDEAVAVAQAYAAVHSSVLLVVTADHETGGMSLGLDSGDDGPFSMPDGTEFYVSWATTAHTAADVPTTALGAWSNLLSGMNENTHIHDVMYRALTWTVVWLPLIVRQ